MMSAKKWNFRKTDVRSMIEAATGAGLKVGRIEMADGKVVVFPTGEEQSEVSETAVNPWDEVINEH